MRTEWTQFPSKLAENPKAPGLDWERQHKQKSSETGTQGGNITRMGEQKRCKIVWALQMNDEGLFSVGRGEGWGAEGGGL